MTKNVVAVVKSVRQLSCVSQDMALQESAAISRKGIKVLGPIRRVRFTKAAQRQANTRENQGPSLGNIQIKILHQRSPCAVKFEDRSSGETAGRERCARGDAWRLAENIYKLKKREAFCSPAEEWILPAASTIKPKEREFVVDSGASMHMVSNGDVMATNEISRDRPEVIFSFRIFAC